ncbi:anti-sigma regulatory factor (Ser/Thr protein kinase) [Saccharopolyspora erythraea NRRL 2338]|uniref:Anti-sigma regulatory factor,serine/threonine protein kinase n=2 Tax=Saccharopolyspora erythraea TaxID=1836 RepID=A4FHD9_SACEN|nr:ATP-binding protein [Saccharopolyspora erythraea]EQD86890.1 serine/threonine protein kinase [Saccharopolyspora erythraea D]PFG97160.1 anti-sigma regulatory factor (Ser/Thr protein kinase) [Saccharopolyspora erythraea NRRL 2338]QRK87362.1 ATP-binding protein [Saccharopolyspora erythraea]CAM03464.1 putative anti-sigma regulatory factor,serine/threonine protein kinase [Saccharopolyspora erythraea NRRL 2338]
MNIDGPAPGAPADPADLHCAGVPAEPRQLSRLRHRLVQWAARTALSADQSEALVLATYEALANTAAHAYPDGTGVVDLRASYQPDSRSVEVTVTDHGQWRPPPEERDGLGGRGLVLIRNMTDHTAVDSGPAGTRVTMRWNLERATAPTV